MLIFQCLWSNPVCCIVSSTYSIAQGTGAGFIGKRPCNVCVFTLCSFSGQFISMCGIQTSKCVHGKFESCTYALECENDNAPTRSRLVCGLHLSNLCSGLPYRWGVSDSGNTPARIAFNKHGRGTSSAVILHIATNIDSQYR